MATNKDIIEKLGCVEARLTNGELEEIHQTVKEIKEVLLDPEDGLIVRGKHQSIKQYGLPIRHSLE